MKVNLSKDWKHKLRIFLDTFFVKDAQNMHPLLHRTLKPYCHNGVKLLMSNANTSSNLGIFTFTIHTELRVWIKVVCSGHWGRDKEENPAHHNPKSNCNNGPIFYSIDSISRLLI